MDVTVLEYDDGLFEKQTSRGITALGGLEFDNALAKMIGGASQIPQARHAWGELLGHDRIVDSGPCRPMSAVARGAAICAASLDGELGDDRDFSLGTSYDLGTAVSAGEREGFRTIIRRNATLPAEGSATSTRTRRCSLRSGAGDRGRGRLLRRQRPCLPPAQR
ncbi:Hsp70 family protein [Streptomyces rubiginosohelvolus]|uniref:Hsp70 family protein n=1 Tax=Streptomyces rubiginosohelvolus TaxID=67362 RepID=UPI0036610E50